MLARSTLGELAECISYDGGESWTDARLSGLDAPSSRFFIARTPSGRVILVRNTDRKERRNMTVFLSDDDGESWAHSVCIDERIATSYPGILEHFFAEKGINAQIHTISGSVEIAPAAGLASPLLLWPETRHSFRS